jgi:hypothetical protein
MKARIKKLKHSLFEAAGDSLEIEADDIQIVSDEPEKREVRAGDVYKEKYGIIVMRYNLEAVLLKELIDSESANNVFLFNLLDLVAETQKVKDGKTETIGGASAHIYNRNYIMFAGMSFSKADAFTLGCQLIGLSQGVGK